MNYISPLLKVFYYPQQVLVSSWLSQLTERCKKMVIDDLKKSGLETQADQQHAAEQMTLAALCYHDLRRAPKASYTCVFC